MKKNIIMALSTVVLVLLLLVLITTLTGCDATSANTVSYNLSKEAEMFNINRRCVFYNGITGEYILVVEGRCSIKADTTDGQLELTCKTGPDSYKKHYLGLSDNVTYFVEQLDGADVDTYHYKVIFKPKAIIPDVDLVN